MIFEKPPSLIFPIILLIGFVICWWYPSSGWVAIALPIIGMILAGSAVVTGADWLIHRFTYYAYLKSDADIPPELELARHIRGMDEARFRVFALALIKEYGDDEETGTLIDQYIDIRTRPTNQEERTYRIEILNYIKKHNGELPAIRETSDGSAKRRMLVSLTAQLIKENAAIAAYGNQNAKVTDYDRAMRILGGAL